MVICLLLPWCTVITDYILRSSSNNSQQQPTAGMATDKQAKPAIRYQAQAKLTNNSETSFS